MPVTGWIAWQILTPGRLEQRKKEKKRKKNPTEWETIHSLTDIYDLSVTGWITSGDSSQTRSVRYWLCYSLTNVDSSRDLPVTGYFLDTGWQNDESSGSVNAVGRKENNAELPEICLWLRVGGLWFG